MKKYLFTLSFLSLVLFIDYVLFILVAVVFNLSGAEYQFYQGPYTLIGFSIFVISLLGAGVYLYQLLPRLFSID